MRGTSLLLALALAGCGGSSSSPPVPPPPLPPPVFSGAISPNSFAVTAGSPGVSMADGVLPFPQCASVLTCWISYALAPVAISSSVGRVYKLTYTVAGTDPVFVHDSANNTTDGHVTVRLLMRSANYRMFSNAQPFELGDGSLAAIIAAGNWILVDLGGNTVVDEALFNAELGHLTGVGFCFGGGFFACHGIAVSSGSARFTVNAASIQ